MGKRKRIRLPMPPGISSPETAADLRNNAPMDLPLVQSTGPQSSSEALIRAMRRTDAIIARTTADEQLLDAATAFTNAERPTVAEANAAFDVRLPEGGDAEAALDDIAAHFDRIGAPCRTLDANAPHWPGELAAAVERRGYRPIENTVYRLGGYKLPPAGKPVQVIPGRAAYHEVRQLAAAQAATRGRDADAREQFADAAIDSLDEPRVDLFLARRDKQPAGMMSLMTLGNIGVLLGHFVMTDDSAPDTSADEKNNAPPDHTIAHTLLTRLMEHCTRAQFEQVILRLPAGDPDAAFYESVGFQKVATYVRYVKS